jgi:hypothetical protein
MKKFFVAIAMVVTGTVYANGPIVTESTNTNYSESVNTTNTNSTSRNETVTKSESTVKSPPPTAVAPAVTTINNDVCAVVASGAVQTQIFGISMGGTLRDMNCERIKLSKNLFDMGMKVAAVATLCQDERVFAAMMAAGTPCPVDGKIGAQAREEWDRRGVVAKTDKIGFYSILAPKVETPKIISNTGCDYQGDDPFVMARVCGQ